MLYKTLNNGVEMPQLGFGVYKVDEKDIVESTLKAIESGYRAIDTAQYYHNERGVGEAIKASGIPHEDLFITSKVWNSHQGYNKTLQAFEESMEKLGLDRLDLYLRSEEHTSELQSRGHLVCRLLLE